MTAWNPAYAARFVWLRRLKCELVSKLGKCRDLTGANCRQRDGVGTSQVPNAYIFLWADIMREPDGYELHASVSWCGVM